MEPDKVFIVQSRPFLLLLFILAVIALAMWYKRQSSDVGLLQSYLTRLANLNKNTETDLSQISVHVPVEPYRLKSYEQMRDIFMTYDLAACKNKVIWGGHSSYQETYKGKYWTADGNYTICVDEKIKPSSGCIVYSIGINHDFSFDENAEQYGCKVFSYDPSMNVAPHMHSKGIKFYDYGISNEDTDKGPNGWKMRRLQSLIAENGHLDSVIDVFKIDVEEAEHNTIPEIVSSGVLRNVKQLAIEMHNKLAHDLPLERYYSTYWQIVNQGFVKFFADDWPGGCERKNEKGEVEVFCYIFSFYNVRFLQ